MDLTISQQAFLEVVIFIIVVTIILRISRNKK